MEDFPLLGFLKVVGVSLAPVVLFGAALHARQAFERAVALGRRWHLLSPALPVPTAPPLEKLAATAAWSRRTTTRWSPPR